MNKQAMGNMQQAVLKKQRATNNVCSIACCPLPFEAERLVMEESTF
jgi:hypothetical protein